MAARAKTSHMTKTTRMKAPERGGLISAVADTISSNPRMSAALAFELGILIGQVVQNRESAYKAIRQQVSRAPRAIASVMPSLGLTSDGTMSRTSKTASKARRKRRTAKSTASAARGRKR